MKWETSLLSLNDEIKSRIDGYTNVWVDIGRAYVMVGPLPHAQSTVCRVPWELSLWCCLSSDRNSNTGVRTGWRSSFLSTYQFWLTVFMRYHVIYPYTLHNDRPRWLAYLSLQTVLTAVGWSHQNLFLTLQKFRCGLNNKCLPDIWTLNLYLVTLFGELWEVWYYRKKNVTGEGLWDHTPSAASLAVFLFFFLCLLMYAPYFLFLLPSAMPPTVTDSPTGTRLQNKPFLPYIALVKLFYHNLRKVMNTTKAIFLF